MIDDASKSYLRHSFDFPPIPRYRASETYYGGPTMLNNNGKPFAFSLIAPYGNMASMLARNTTGLPCRLSIREGVALDEATAVTHQEIKANKPEIIFSRGGTADYIRSCTDIPVVSIATTALDLLRTLQPFSGKIRNVAFFSYQKQMPEVQLIADTLTMRVAEYCFHTREEFISHMIEAKARGAELAAGGILVVRMRETMGIEGVLVEAGEDAVQRAVNEAFSLAKIRRTELQRQARMQTLLDSITEGIIATDESNTLTLVNPTAERLLGISATNAVGRDAREIIPNNRTAAVLSSGQAELNDVQVMGGTTILTNRVPIVVDGRTVGVVCTFSEADRIQKAEQYLRGTMLPKGFKAKYTFDDIITTDPAMEDLKSLAAMYAATDATILLEGESGTGKELFAQGIHRESSRNKGPFVAVNCAAIPETLLESELFGYEEGAFSGASRQGKCGFFERSHRGTLFLDEVSELPLSMQTRLLRVLQEREIVRIGGSRVIPVDIRIICATNRNLEAWTKSGSFRQDLYYRLNVLPLSIPPLRDRPGDIRLLAETFLQKNLPSNVRFPNKKDFKRDVLPRLMSHTWPGNIRELRNTMERLSIAMTVMRDIPLHTVLCKTWPAASHIECTSHSEAPDCDASLKTLTRDFERKIIQTFLAQHSQNQSYVAKRLGISRMSLWRKIQKDDHKNLS